MIVKIKILQEVRLISYIRVLPATMWKLPINASHVCYDENNDDLLINSFLCLLTAENNLTEQFIVPVDTIPRYGPTTNEPPPPPPIKAYYLPYNFIIDSVGNIFFYQQEQFRWMCGTGIYWDTPPEFIGLKPKDISQIPDGSIEQFITLNILSQDPAYRRVAIASLLDTIRSTGLSSIISTFKDAGNHVKWIFRKTTLEETIVLTYKQWQSEYVAEDIIWDSAKIRFSPTLKNMLKFTAPKVEEE